MLTYNEIIRSCKRLKLNPDKRGDNIYARGRPILCFENPFDFSSINFPTKERTQIEKIGQLLNNLLSQKKFPAVYNLSTVEGKKENIRDRNIKKITSTIEESLNGWLKKGQAKCKVKKELTIYQGFVYEINPERVKAMEDLNSQMREVKRDSRRKSAQSAIDAKNVILR